MVAGCGADSAGTRPAGAVTASSPAGGFSPRTLERAYGVLPLLCKGLDGRGQTVVLPEFGTSGPGTSSIRQDVTAFDGRDRRARRPRRRPPTRLSQPGVYRIAHSAQYRRAFTTSPTATTPSHCWASRSPVTARTPAGTRPAAGAAPTPRSSSHYSPKRCTPTTAADYGRRDGRTKASPTTRSLCATRDPPANHQMR
jgi:hypothetical protein